MRATSLPPLSLADKVTLAACGLLLIFAAWVSVGAVDSVGSGTPPSSTETRP